jgi:hypothetical protein
MSRRSWQVVTLLAATLTLGLTAGVFGDAPPLTQPTTTPPARPRRLPDHLQDRRRDGTAVTVVARIGGSSASRSRWPRAGLWPAGAAKCCERAYPLRRRRRYFPGRMCSRRTPGTLFGTKALTKSGIEDHRTS